METSALPILVAVALPADRTPLEPLLRMSSDASWQVHLLHAAPPPVRFKDEPDSDQSPVLEEYEQGLYHLNDELVSLAEWFEDAGIHVVFRLEEGPIVETILLMAEEIDAQMIVIVGQRHVISHRPVLGSVATTLLRIADRPVLVLPTLRGTDLDEHESRHPGMDSAVDRLLAVLDRGDIGLTATGTREMHEMQAAAQDVRDRAEASHDTSNRLLRALHRFETEHPSLTRAINDVAYYLSGTGI